MHDEFRMDGEQLGLDRAHSAVVLSEAGTLTAELRASGPPTAAGEWALSPPCLYFRDVPLALAGGQRVLVVDDDVVDEHDIALYFIEHRDVAGTLTLSMEGTLTFDGIVRLGHLGRARVTPLTVQWTRRTRSAW